MRARHSAAAGFTLAAFLGACADAGPELPATLDALAFDTVFTIEPTPGTPWAELQGVWDADLDPDGRLAILDLGGPAVHVFDASGGPVASLTELGLEEGQLDGPAGVAWGAPGSLLVWDPGASWISRFRAGNGGLDFVDRSRAFAFGETGFCAHDGRVWLSYWQDDLVVHEIGEQGPVGSFGQAPEVIGAGTLGPELRDIAVEELTPSALLCTDRGVLDVSFVQSGLRLHDADGSLLWSRTFDDYRPIVVYTTDGIGLGREFDADEGSQMLRSLVSWGPSMALVQHELRLREFPEEGDVEVIESRLIRLDDGTEVARSRSMPLVLAARGNRLVLVESTPSNRVTVVELH